MAAIYDTILDDIMNTLFKKPEQISFEDFQDKYSTGFVQDKGPFGGIKDERHYYAFGDNEYNPFRDSTYWEAGDKGRTTYKYLGFKSGTPEGYEFSSPEDAYDKYISSIQDMPEFSTADLFNSQSILENMAITRGVDIDELGDPDAFRPFNISDLKKLTPGYYTEDVEEERGSILANLMSKNKKALSLGGGLAGYGQRQAGTVSAKEDYITETGNIYTGIEEKKTGALEDIYNILGQYQSLV